MKVVLFATALLAAGVRALQITPAPAIYQESPYLQLAQISDMPNMGSNPQEQEQLVARAKAALIKDDRHHMGKEKSDMIQAIEKKLSGKDKKKARELAMAISDTLEGREIGGDKKKPEQKPEPKKAPEQKQESSPEPTPLNDESSDNDDAKASSSINVSSNSKAKSDLKSVMDDMNGKFSREEDKEKVRHIIREVTTKLNNEHKAKMDEQKEKMTQVIEKQALKIKDMGEKYKEKHDIDVKRAVLKYQNSLKHVNDKVYHVMEKQMGQNIRSVVVSAINGFREGEISKSEISQLIHKYFNEQHF